MFLILLKIVVAGGKGDRFIAGSTGELANCYIYIVFIVSNNDYIDIRGDSKLLNSSVYSLNIV